MTEGNGFLQVVDGAERAFEGFELLGPEMLAASDAGDFFEGWDIEFLPGKRLNAAGNTSFLRANGHGVDFYP